MPVNIVPSVPIGMYQVPGTPYFVMDPSLIGVEAQRAAEKLSAEPLLKPSITPGEPATSNTLSASVDDAIWETRRKRARLSLIVASSGIFLPIGIYALLLVLQRRLYDAADLAAIMNMTVFALMNVLQFIFSISGATHSNPKVHGLLRVMACMLVLTTAVCAGLTFGISGDWAKTNMLVFAAVLEAFFFTGLHWQKQVMEKDPAFANSNEI